MQSCVYLQVEDTVEHCLDGKATMEEAPLIAGVVEFEDAIEIECALWNASIDGCKDVLLAFCSFDDDEDEGGEEHEGDARMFNDLSFGGIRSTGVVHELDSNLADYFGQGNQGQLTQMVGQKAVHSLADDVDLHEDAMSQQSRCGISCLSSFNASKFQPQHSAQRGMHLFHLLIQFQIGFVFSS